MSKISVCSLFVIFLIFAFSFLSLSAEVITKPSEDLLPAAEKILSKKFENPIWQERVLLPYFQPWDNFMDFRLGEPFPFYVLNAKAIHDLKDKKNFENTLEFSVWKVPIYLGDEKEPRTLLAVEKKSDGEWHFTGMGGLPKYILEARERWPADEGYSHAPIYIHNMPGRLIMLEKADTLQIYICSSDPGTAKNFGISKSSDGYYPLLSLDFIIEHIKGDKRYIKREMRLE